MNVCARAVISSIKFSYIDEIIYRDSTFVFPKVNIWIMGFPEFHAWRTVPAKHSPSFFSSSQYFHRLFYHAILPCFSRGTRGNKAEFAYKCEALHAASFHKQTLKFPTALPERLTHQTSLDRFCSSVHFLLLPTLRGYSLPEAFRHVAAHFSYVGRIAR